MIESIALKDFQKHNSLHVTFDPVTTIVGPSDSGKTAILRALAWIIENKPSGKSLMRDGTSDVRARITVDGHTVTRVTTKSKNLYLLDQVELAAFGRNVPTEVLETLRVSPASFQRQMDGVFLLSMSGGDAAKYLNEVSGISVLDRAVKLLATDVKSLTTKASGISEAQVEADNAEKAASSLSNAIAALEGLKAQAEALEALQREIEALEGIVKSANITVREVPDLATEFQEIEDLCKQIDTLQPLVTSAVRYGESLARCEAEVNELEEQLSKIEVCPTCQRPL